MHEVGVNEDIFNRYYCIFYLRKFLVFFAENENDLTQDTFCNLCKKNFALTGSTIVKCQQILQAVRQRH